MVVIRMDALAEVYINYKFTLSFIKREKAIEDGINKILLRLNRYKRDPVIYTLKSAQAMRELENILERFYYQDRKFSKLIVFKARSFIAGRVKK
jgi:hypothetical protein